MIQSLFHIRMGKRILRESVREVQRKIEYKYEERMSAGDMIRNMVTIGLVVAVMFHFVIQ